MVNRKREPWWNRKSSVMGAAAVSRRSKFLSGHRLSSSSTLPDAAVSRGSNNNTAVVDTTSSQDSTSLKEGNQPVDCGSSSTDVTPTRDELPLWAVVDNTTEAKSPTATTNVDNLQSVSVYDINKSKDPKSIIVGLQDNSIHGTPKEPTDAAATAKPSEFYGPPEPCSSVTSLPNLDNCSGGKSVTSSSAKNSESLCQKEKSASESRKLAENSALSGVSISTSVSDKSLTRSKSSSSSSSKKLHKDKPSKHTKCKEDKLSKKQNKKSKSDNRGEERRPRTLTVAYDKLREKNGTSLPPRTYNPLDPNGIYSKHWSANSTKPYTQRPQNLKRKSSGDKQSSHHGSGRSSSEKGSDAPPKLDRGRSSSQDASKERVALSPQRNHKLSDKYSSSKSSLTSSRNLGNKLFSKNSSSHPSHKFARSKSLYSSHVKRNVIKKIDKPIDQSSWMKLSTDGIGIQKIRQNQRKTFLATCVEEYSLQTNGSMAKDVKPLLAFKVGNPQFVAEFYEKKTELNELPMLDGASMTRIMKEKFAFKVKLGLEKLDTFITEGITVNGQSSFFSLFRTSRPVPTNTKNAVLLYRYADVCLAWTSPKNIPKTTPIFLLIHKVVYGRCKTYSHLGDAMYVKQEHQCDCLKASLIGMRRKDEEQSEIRRGLACSKVILADFDRKTGGYRERPRQILPYAIVLYCRNNLTESEQSDLKEMVLDWKSQFEAHRWKLLTAAEHSHKQMLMQQQQSQQRAGLLPVPDASLIGNMSPSQPLWQQMPPIGMPLNPPSLLGNMPCSSSFIENPAVLQSGLGMPQYLDMHLAPNSSAPPNYPRQGILPLGVDTSGHPLGIDNHSFTPPNHHPEHQNNQQSPSRKRRRSHSRSSIESDSHSSKSKHSRGDRPVDADLDRMVSEALSSHRRSMNTKDVGVQVKPQSTIISLQKKSVSLTASTQTPDLEKDDSYEAELLRGGPREATCCSCRKKVDASNSNPSPEVSTEAVEGAKMLARLFTNGNERPRNFKSLSSRFADADDKSNMDDMLLDEHFESN